MPEYSDHNKAKDYETNAIVLFYHDLRISDNPALATALNNHKNIIPLYVLDDNLGAASKWWLYNSLLTLKENLDKIGLPLILRKGDMVKTLRLLCKECNIAAVYYNNTCVPERLKALDILKIWGQKASISFTAFDGNTLFNPDDIQSGNGRPYKVFTPFWKTCKNHLDAVKVSASPASSVYPSEVFPASDDIEDWDLLPQNPNWAKKFDAHWTPGEQGAQKELSDFLDNRLMRYNRYRDFPALNGTSRLSPHLHFGEISPKTIVQSVQARIIMEENTEFEENAHAFLRQLGWREFCIHLLLQHSDISDKPINKKFEHFKWSTDKKAVIAWQNGLTGYPLVDAGMRQLWQTGWMHNRIRMISASFLVKHLLIDWRLGEKWFWDTLVDADLANNAGGWQWVAGCGADAAPYFRIFNPVLQSRNFDAQGLYIKEWIPELKKLPSKYIHAPWEAPKDILLKAGIELGKNYPKPIVDHKQARNSALDMYQSL